MDTQEQRLDLFSLHLWSLSGTLILFRYTEQGQNQKNDWVVPPEVINIMFRRKVARRVEAAARVRVFFPNYRSSINVTLFLVEQKRYYRVMYNLP